MKQSETKAPITFDNPLGLDKIYEWQAGDTFATIALKYRRPYSGFLELVDHNKRVLMNNRYIMKPGDLIGIPEHWFPLPPLQTERQITRFKGSFGYVS